MNASTQLIIGMPAGSLADPTRGGSMNALLRAAGFDTKGYDQGGPTRFTTVNFLFGWDGRPQEFGAQLESGELDLAITGDDWVRERRLEMEMVYGQTYDLERVMPLGRGAVSIVGISGDPADKSTPEALKRITAKSDLITIVTEMPYLALKWARDNVAAAGLGDQFAAYSVQKYRTPPRIQRGILIYETWGKTEAKLKNGGADLALEITQSGSAIRSYGLKILETVMTSEAAVYINKNLRKNPEKLELARMFLLNLFGALNAEDKVMVVFDAPRDCAAAIEKYLQDNHLFADEPSKTEGEKFIQYSIQMLTADPNIPIARARYELARLGARSINTMPLTSAIPGISCAGL
ncbi:MAG: hypothetical protein NTX50_15620 [Candidatus Sumerlaeota bacterium]|nr:hypothetical protein [Candidatus Sumerlaeota bacterium]